MCGPAEVVGPQRLRHSRLGRPKNPWKAYPIGQTDSSPSSEASSPLDDEVEVPDGEEDDVPDDPGQALDLDARPVPLQAVLGSPNSELVAPASRPYTVEGARGGIGRAGAPPAPEPLPVPVLNLPTRGLSRSS
jgi:hypothetical protein